MKQHSKRIIGAAIIAMILSTCCSFMANPEGSQAVIKNHPQPGIWNYINEKNQPEKALVLTLQQELWQATAAACITPAFIDRINDTPLLFDDGSEEREVQIPHDTKAVTDFGEDLSTASKSIATTYWTKAEIVLVITGLIVINSTNYDYYERVLWSIPLASFLSAPILINPSEQTFDTLQTQCAIVIGHGFVEVDQVIELEKKEDVWSFQLELFDTKGQVCNYIVATNPFDTSLNDNIKWKYLSLTSAPLAAFRRAIVQTGAYTGDRKNIDTIARATKDMGDTYQEIKPFFEKVKADTYAAAKFLMDHGHNPEFLALVGGPYAIPDYYFDYHISYFYWGAKVDYVASTAPYGNLTYNLTYETYPYEDLGVGRIVGHSLLDTSILLMRTFSYRDFLKNGNYANLTPISWENNSSVIEGHRLNQPNFGGPPASNDEPYLPAGEVDQIFSAAGFNETYYLPRNFTISNDTNMPTGEILDRAFSSSSMILINAHGGLPGEQALLEIGIDPIIEKEYLYTLDENEAVKRPLVPSVVYVIACETGTIAVDLSMDDYISLGFIHSGLVAYIAPDTYQTICFWDKAPEGPEADQTIYFFQRLLNENIPIGKALSIAKWKSYGNWRNDTSYEDDVAGVTLHLFGDPAFEPYKPNVPYVDKKEFDVYATYDGIINAGSKLDVTVSITDLNSGLTINDAEVKTTFQKVIRSGYASTFTAPNEKGTYHLEISVSKEGYQDLNVKYIVTVPDSKEDFNPLILIGSGIIISLIFIAIYVIKKSRIKDSDLRGKK